MIDRDGIRKLLLVYSTGRLCHEFGISAPTFRRYMKGAEPYHPPMIEHINRRVKDMLISKPVPIAAFESYVDDFANHRLSLATDNKYVRRYPIARCYMRWEATTECLYVHKGHFVTVMNKRHPGLDMVHELTELGCLSGESKFSLLQGSGMNQRQTLNLCFDLGDEHMEDVKRILERSAEREEPDQDGRIFA